MTIFWIGDLAHQGDVSGHNPDDYPPLRAELTDSDLIPEVRALDFMIGPKFTAADARALVNALVTGPDRPRLYYVIYNRKIYRRAVAFQPADYAGSDPHTSHVHVSGYVSDDANGADWTSVLELKEDNVTPAEFLKILKDPAVAQAMRAMPWQYVGGGLPVGISSLKALNDTYLNAKTAAEKPVSTPAPVDVAALVTALTPAIRAIVREELDKTHLGPA